MLYDEKVNINKINELNMILIYNINISSKPKALFF